MEHVHIQTHHLEIDLRLAALSNNAVDEGDDLLDLNMGLVGTGLDHHDLVHGGGNGQGQVAHLALFLGGVQDDLAVHQAHLNTADGAVPGDLRHSGDQRRTDHTGDLRAAIGVQAHHGHGDADIVAHLLGEQRAHVELFLILHVQGEEIHTFAGLGAHHNVAQHAGLAVADQGACVGQAAHLAHLDLERTASQRGLVDLEVFKGLFAGTKFNCHCFCLLCPFAVYLLIFQKAAASAS